MLAALVSAIVVGNAPFSFRGTFVEGCSCKNACTFEITGKLSGCSGAGFYAFDSGTYKGANLAGGKVAFAAGAAGWLRLYFDGPTPAVRAASRKFITDALSDWGTPDAVAWKPITVVALGGNYVGLVADGKVLNLQTEPPAEAHTFDHIFNSKLHPTIMLGKTLSCRFADGNRAFAFNDSNSFFNPAVAASGKL